MKSFVHALKLIGVYFLMYCVFVALSALVVPLEKLQGTQSSEPVRAEDAAKREPSTVMPTATLWISGDSPFSSGPSKCINGTMYVYADRAIAVYVSSGNDNLPADGSTVRVYQLTKDQGKKVLVPVALGERNTADGTMTFGGGSHSSAALYFDSYNDKKVYEYSAGIMTEYADMRVAENRPCDLVSDSELATVAHMITPAGMEEQQAQQEAKEQAQRQHSYEVSRYGTPVLIVMAVFVAVMLVIFFALKESIDDAECDIRHAPVLYDTSDDGSQMTISPNMPALPSWFAAAQFAALAIVGVEVVVFAVPSFAEVVLASGFSNVLYGIGFVVLAIALMLLQFLVFDNLYERIGLAEGCGESEEGTFATFIHLGAVVFFNFMGFVFALGAPNVLPLVFANLCLAVPTTVIDWRRSHGRTPMHWLQLFNQAFMWMSMGVLLAAWMVCQMFIKLLEMKNASDKAEAQAAARRRQEEGNSFIVSDGNGGTLTMNRIGDTDDFACSDGHTYTRSGGSGGYYGDYEKRY